MLFCVRRGVLYPRNFSCLARGFGSEGAAKKREKTKKYININDIVKCKGIPRLAEVALGVPGRLRHRIFSTFGTKRVVGRQPNAPSGHMVLKEGTTEKNPK